MNRTMTKNICLVAAFFITAILAVLMMGNNAGATASAVSADFEFVLREVEDPDAEDLSVTERNLLRDGEFYAFEWHISYNQELTGGISFGAFFKYDGDNFEPVAYGDTYVYRVESPFTHEDAIDTDAERISVTAAASSGVGDGEFLTVYFKKKANASSTAHPIEYITLDKLNYIIYGQGAQPVTTPMPTGSICKVYSVGDINGNGVVDADDAMALLQAMSGVSSISESQWSTYSSRFPNVVCFAQADANVDGVITSADSNAILNYYSQVLVGGYTGPIGENHVYVQN